MLELGCFGLGRSRGGLSTKIHAAGDALGNPVRLIGSPGQRNDIAFAHELVDGFAADVTIADKGYGADLCAIRSQKQAARSSSRQNATGKTQSPTIKTYTKPVISSKTYSQNLKTSAPSPRAMTNSLKTSSPAFTSPPLSSGSIEDAP